MSRIYYKVCATYDNYPNKYFSFNLSPSYEDLCLEYKLNVWTFPIIKNSRLYCFDNIGEARDFMRYNMGYSYIFSCNVKNPRSTKWIGDPLNPFRLRSYLETKSKHLKYNAPRGTISASAIKILEKIVDKQKRIYDEL
jgi:hypothetical protein